MFWGRICPHFPGLYSSSDIIFWSPVQSGCWAAQTTGLTCVSLIFFIVIWAQLRRVAGRKGQTWSWGRSSFGRKALRRSPAWCMGVLGLPGGLLFARGWLLMWTIFFNLSPLPAGRFEGWAVAVSRTGTWLQVLLFSYMETFSSQWFHTLPDPGGGDIDLVSILYKEPMLPTE